MSGSEPRDESPVRPRRKRWAHVVVAIALVWLVIEAVAFIAFGLATGSAFSFDDVAATREAVLEERFAELAPRPDRGPVPEWQVLHPYLGFVLQPSPQEGLGNDYGFIGELPPFAIGSLDAGARAGERAIVAVVGGSVAQRMAHVAGDELARELAGNPCFGEREIVVANLALPGVKQPQQLLTLAYFLSVGAAIDVLVSLDGFNEIALPIAENLEQGVSPFYPRNWKFRVRGVQDVDSLRQIGALEFWREGRKGLARFVGGTPLRFSVAANTLWWLIDRGFERRLTLGMLDLTLREQERPAGEEDFTTRGPRREYASEVEHYADLVAVWERSTHLMAQASEAAGIASFHFLQPNQRVPGSKPMGDEERRVALPRHQLYDAPARRGYPELIAAAARMQAAGLPFDDLTMVFADVEQALYVDGCCHVNEEGSQRLARAIAERIRERFAAGQACPRYAPIDRE